MHSLLKLPNKYLNNARRDLVGSSGAYFRVRLIGQQYHAVIIRMLLDHDEALTVVTQRGNTLAWHAFDSDGLERESMQNAQSHAAQKPFHLEYPVP